MIGLLRAAYRAVRGRVVEQTGRRWRRPERKCPPWCAGDHTCTARHGHPSGEHRSSPVTLRTWYGVLVATRLATLDGRTYVELRAQVQLDPVDERLALEQSAFVPMAVDLAIRTTLGQLARCSIADSCRRRSSTDRVSACGG